MYAKESLRELINIFRDLGDGFEYHYKPWIVELKMWQLLEKKDTRYKKEIIIDYFQLMLDNGLVQKESLTKEEEKYRLSNIKDFDSYVIDYPKKVRLRKLSKI